MRMLNSTLLGAQNEQCPTCVARLRREMCSMISIGSGFGGMDACSLVVRWGVCKFGSMVVRLLVAWFGCCSVLPCSLAFFVACVFAWRGSNVKSGRAGCHVASFGALI